MAYRLLPLVILAVAAGPLAAQQPPPARSSAPIINLLLPYVSDENLGKSLKLTAEQVKSLTDFRQKQWDERYTTPTDKYAEGTAYRNKATAELFKKTLSEEQHKRAMQLATRLALSNAPGFRGARGQGAVQNDLTRVPASFLSTYPELAASLKLTDDQKKLVESPRAGGPGATAAVAFLTAEQTKVLKEMAGEPAGANLVAPFDERMNYAFRETGSYGNAPGLLGLTEAKDVRTELGMTEEQTKTLADLAAKWQVPTGPASADPTLSPEGQAKANEKQREEREKAMATVLKPEQMTRLKQIWVQTNGGNGFGGFGGGPGGVAPPTPLTEKINSFVEYESLAITDAQTKAFDEADKAQADAIEKAVLSDASVDDSIKAIEAARAAREKAYEAVVTAEQKKKLDESYGKPFTGSVMPDRMSAGRPPETLKNMRAASFGKRATSELRLLASNKAIQDDLGLKPDQLKAITAKSTEATTKFSTGFRATQDLAAMEKSYAEQAEFVEKALADVFTADQAKRWQELLVQRAEILNNQNRGGGIGATNLGVIAVPGVADAVKLTAEQKKKLLDEGKPDEVLTAEQKATIKELAGKKHEGDFAVGPRGGFTPTQRSTWPTTAAILRAVPSGVFKITPEQTDKFAEALNRYQLETLPEPPMPVEGGGFRGGRVDPEKAAAANVTLTKALATLLSAEQLARVEQVKYQAVAQSAGINLLANAEVVKALSLTKEQTEKNAALVSDAQRLTQAAGVPFAFGGGGFGFGSWTEKYTEKVQAKAMALLTDEQKATWKKLTGEPVPNMPRNLVSPGFGGPGGGFGSF